MKRALMIISVLTLSACAAGPDFAALFTKADDTDGFINDIYANPQQGSMARWWERIDDPLLNVYVERLLTDNLQLAEAQERAVQARERLRIENGSFFPSVGADGGASRGFAPGGQSGSERVYATSYDADLSASWEIDLFGKLRRSSESASASYGASVYDKEALVHSLIAELVRTRVAIAVNQRLLELARENAENRKTFSDVIRRRYDLGTQGTTASDVYLAQDNYTSVQADVHEFERLLAADVYTLDVLLGQAPGTTDPTVSEFSLMPPPVDVPFCLPADLLDRRPDLRASELRAKAANADIGVAVADLYPSVNLGAAIGFSSDQTANFFNAANLAGSILSSITMRLFEGGALRANIRLQESEARELAAAYADDVLNAMREVETALKAEEELRHELHNLGNSVGALRRAEDISKGRFSRGIETLRDVLDIQQRRYASEQLYIRRQQEKWNTRVALYLALGGDWFEPEQTFSCGKGRNL